MVKEGYKQTEIGVIPEDWEVKKLGDIGNPAMCKRVFKSQTKKDGDIPFYKIGTFGKKADSYIDNKLYHELKRKFFFPKRGDILISASGTIGRTVVYNGEDAYFQDSNIVWIDNNEKIVLNNFLKYYYKVVKWTTENTTISRLYNDNLKEIIIPIPPKPEQKAIATALSDIDNFINSLEQLIAKKEAIKKATMQQLLTGKKRLKGFSGEWEEKRLGEMSSMYSGGTPSSKIEEYYNGDIKWVSIADITKAGKYLYDTEKKITNIGLANSSAKIFPKNTLLFAMYASIGKSSIALDEVATSQAILGINVKKSLSFEYLYYFLVLNRINLINQGQQGTQANLNKDLVQNTIIFLPSIQEQKAIAKILSDMDKEIEVLKSKLDKSKAIKTGMMQELLTGRVRLIK